MWPLGIPEHARQGVPGASQRGSRRRQSQSYHSSRSGRRGRLDPEFVVQDRDFFKYYKVFQVFWHENAGLGGAGESASSISYDESYGEAIFSKPRRMILIAKLPLYCICVPIQTYGQQGTSKPGVVAEHHAIVYTNGIHNAPLQKEREAGTHDKMLPSIRVVSPNPLHVLAPESRLNFSEFYTVHYNCKIKPFGNVDANFHGLFDRLRAQVSEQIFRPAQQIRSLPAMTVLDELPPPTNTNTADSGRDEHTNTADRGAGTSGLPGMIVSATPQQMSR